MQHTLLAERFHAADQRVQAFLRFVVITGSAFTLLVHLRLHGVLPFFQRRGALIERGRCFVMAAFHHHAALIHQRLAPGFGNGAVEFRINRPDALAGS